MSDEVQDMTQEQAAEATSQVVNDPIDVNKKIDNEFYIRDLIKTYMDKIDKERDRNKFVTFSRGIMQEMQQANNNLPLERTGDYSYRAVFDLAWEGMYGEEEPATAVKDEPKAEVLEQKTEPQGAPPLSTKRTPGDIQPAVDGDEMESYSEKLGLKNYAKARAKLTKMTKTLKTTHASEQGLDDIMKSLDADE